MPGQVAPTFLPYTVSLSHRLDFVTFACLVRGLLPILVQPSADRDQPWIGYCLPVTIYWKIDDRSDYS